MTTKKNKWNKLASHPLFISIISSLLSFVNSTVLDIIFWIIHR